MTLDRTARLALVAALAALCACGTGRRTSEARQATGCTSCHGGSENASGAPPNDLHGNTATTSRGVGHHTAHVEAGIGCGACHPDRTSIQNPGHLDGKVDVQFRGVAVAGGAAPTYDAATGTCANVYCHGATIPAAARRAAPTWTAPLAGPRCLGCHDAPPAAAGHPAATDCASCHPDTVDADGALRPGGKHVNGVADAVRPHADGYADRASAAFHGPDAIAFLQRRATARDCGACHGSDLGGGVAPSCNACHAAAGWSAPRWQSNCTFCHGARDPAFDYAASLAEAAPPADVSGGDAAAKVGAHRQHLATALTANVACASCHAVPAPSAPLEHLGGAAAVTLAAGGVYDPASQSCATACHGASGSPAWASAAALGCDGCHGAPPATGRHPGNEPKHAWMGSRCDICHADVADQVPSIVGKAKHVNGVVDVKLAIGTWDGASCSTGCHATFTPFPWAKP